ncbi:MAG: hypothetical protein ABIJ56_04320 [Pseudomonadota bacterium]
MDARGNPMGFGLRIMAAGAAAVLVVFALGADAQKKKGGQDEEMYANMPDDERPKPPKPGGWAGDFVSLVEWVIQTQDLVPRKKDDKAPWYGLDSMKLTGSVDDNTLQFTIKGNLVSKKPMRVQLFGPVDRVMLSNVTINDDPAVVGFDSNEHYFVLTDEESFTIEGDMALKGDLSFTIPGPLNLFTASLDDGRVVEGDMLSGLNYTTVHLEAGKAAEQPEEELPPIFQVSRALRIQKEIAFEYTVTVRSGTEVSSVTLPLAHMEIVLDVPGHKGWKQENNELIVPTSGRQVEFTVYGRMPELGAFSPDPRSSYEWWLIESDSEHRVEVVTGAKQVDSVESPIARQLESARLFLVMKGQELDVSVKELASMEALAVVVSSQSRSIVWTKEGDLVAEDYFSYENNGIDYLAVKTAGKPMYLEIDGEPQKILSDDEEKKDRILVPLRKGTHSVRIQSVNKSDPSLFGGSLAVPVAAHALTASQASVMLGMHSRIIPLWFSGGEGVQSPIRGWDIVFMVIALFMGLLLFPGGRAKIAGVITMAGIYFLNAPLFVALVVVTIAIAFVVLILRKFHAWKRVLAFGIVAALLVVIAVVLSIFLAVAGSSMKYEKHAAMEDKARFMTQMDSTSNVWVGEEEGMGQRGSAVQQKINQQIAIGNVPYAELASVKGVTPVALPTPSYDRSVNVSRELVTKDRPLAPTLLYVTRNALWPLLVIWILCLALSGIQMWPRTRKVWGRIVEFWNKPGEKPPEKKAASTFQK